MCFYNSEVSFYIDLCKNKFSHFNINADKGRKICELHRCQTSVFILLNRLVNKDISTNGRIKISELFVFLDNDQ